MREPSQVSKALELKDGTTVTVKIMGLKYLWNRLKGCLMMTINGHNLLCGVRSCWYPCREASVDSLVTFLAAEQSLEGKPSISEGCMCVSELDCSRDATISGVKGLGDKSRSGRDLETIGPGVMAWTKRSE
uniref:DUF4283 domain-containing protein n=1 Tax=Steinernema glaseri TaxID=37863 RepID=A0A1I8AS58_9BILA